MEKFRKVEVEDSRAATASFARSFTFDPVSVITSDINDQLDATSDASSDDDQHPDCPLPNPDVLASNFIARDLNSL